MFPSPKLGLSLKLIRPTRKLLRARFPSPKLGLSLKFNFEKYINAVDEKFPSPKLGLSLKSSDYFAKRNTYILVSVP